MLGYEGEKFLSVNNPKNQGVYIGTVLQDGSVILKAMYLLGMEFLLEIMDLF